MNTYFLLMALVSRSVCSLPFTIRTAGLYESMVSSPKCPKCLSEDQVLRYKLDKIEISSRFSVLVSLNVFHKELNTNDKSIYGIVNYDVFRSLFYTDEVQNHETIQVKYDMSIFKKDSEMKDSCFNVRFLNLTQDKNNTLELKGDTKDYYMNIIGSIIKNQYERMMCQLDKQVISEFKIPDNIESKLFYYKNHEECLNEIKSIMNNSVDIIGNNIFDSARKFSSYFGSKIGQEELSNEQYVEAIKMITDLYNILGFINCSNHKVSYPFHGQAPVVRNEVVKVYKSVCLYFGSDYLSKESTFSVTGFDFNDQPISGDKFLTKKIDSFILIPFKDLIKLRIQSIEVNIDGKSTGKIPVSRLIIRDDAPVKTNN